MYTYFKILVWQDQYWQNIHKSHTTDADNGFLENWNTSVTDAEKWSMASVQLYKKYYT